MGFLEEKRFDDALFQFLRVFISETSGVLYGNRVSLVRNLLIKGFPSYKYVQRLVLRLDMGEEEFRDMFVYSWGKTRGELPNHYLRANKCYQCFFLASQKKEDDLEALYNNAYQRLQEEYDDETLCEVHRIYPPYDHAERFGPT
ncbi:hypothetical protein DYE48_17510 [Halobacillus trueperi]|uniref:Uncharacterized protein n=1 Tax=Halobacillus trueperi TaxID=156205 RepID=A0A3E0J214_9BACI|nr:hypothetical protein DYE48_17510 [Halobacillus trueperi]